jgi:3-isopropylmalate/(R)-2-methylmalate dehydratase small subunit
VDGPAVALARDNIDTDQIIPGRFLKTTGRVGLGAHLFADWRGGPEGEPRPDFVLNTPAASGARFLVAGRNFGCGSSREHAPWALMDFGFRAVVAGSFADIFRQNALKNGLLPVAIPAPPLADLLAVVERTPGVVLAADLVRQVLTLPDGREVAFAIDPFARACLISGVDEIGYVLRQDAAIARYESARASSGG